MASHVPREKLKVSFSRSSGPGGQNVNQVATRAEIRFSLEDADWLEDPVRERLAEKFRRCTNREGEFFVASQRFRTQNRNLEDAIERLESMVAEAKIEPKERKLKEGLSTKTKETRVKAKRHRSDIKSKRGRQSLE